MRGIGLHLRLATTFPELFERSRELSLPLVQCFFTNKNGALLALANEEIVQSVASAQGHFAQRFMHASYWTNLSGASQVGRHILMREIELAKRLEFTHAVVHPGSAKDARHRSDGIDFLVRSLNKLFASDPGITIVLENVAHGRMNIGGDLRDFHQVLQKIDKPDAIKFCIDTAHAFSYGYNIAVDAYQDEFINLVDSYLGIERVALIHLNDTYEKLGSKVDRHAAPGQGMIGERALKRFALDSRLTHIPMILELPVLEYEEEKVALDRVRGWHSE